MTAPLVVKVSSAEQCGACGSINVGVVDSRPHDYGRLRRRLCRDCGARWSTLETRIGERATTDDARAAVQRAIVLMNEAWNEMERARDLISGHLVQVDGRGVLMTLDDDDA